VGLTEGPSATRHLRLLKSTSHDLVRHTEILILMMKTHSPACLGAFPRQFRELRVAEGLLQEIKELGGRSGGDASQAVNMAGAVRCLALVLAIEPADAET
jgi:hypothetical protein